MSLHIHENILQRLEYFKSIQKIPNIIFHGPSGSGKRTIVKRFIDNIYDTNKEKIKSFVIYVNCAHGKGIKFIREELKFFAKSHINSNGGNIFKSVVLLNADKLTMDAQSALRRCIEVFSHNTRFFLVVENKYNLLKPILSRFCEIYIPQPIINDKPVNLYKYNLETIFDVKEVVLSRENWLKKEIMKLNHKKPKIEELIDLSSKLYEKSYSGLDLINLLENTKTMDNILDDEKRYELLLQFNKVKKEFRNEKLLMFFILNFLFVSLEVHLENISFM
jgi:Cdc6-like AAA superfamily ATPase